MNEFNLNTGNYLTEPDYDHPFSPYSQENEPNTCDDVIEFMLYDSENREHCFNAMVEFWDSAGHRHVVVNYISTEAKEMADNCPILISDVLEEAVRDNYMCECIVRCDVW